MSIDLAARALGDRGVHGVRGWLLGVGETEDGGRDQMGEGWRLRLEGRILGGQRSS